MANKPGDKMTLQQWAAAGGDVPLSFRGREKSWANQVRKFAAGGDVNMQAGGVAKLAKMLKGTQEVLPAAQREANLQKMLSESKVQQRLYHGTTATEGGKGQEAIRRFKPSKEGALGSGTYLTPNPGFAGEYAPKSGGNMLPVYAKMKNPLIIEGKGDPMIEALIKLGMNESAAGRMVENAYERKGYIGKEVENRARAAGYDGLMQYRDGNLSEVVSYNPNAVKSAIGNKGTYDTSKPDLNEAKGGAVHMADGGKVDKPYIGYRRAGRRPESQQNREAAKNVPVDLARGFISGALGMPGDLESLARLPYELITGNESPTILPTSGDIEKRLPFKSDTPVSRLATEAGQLGGGFYTGPGSAARAITAVPRAIKKAGQDFVQSAGQTVSPLTVYHGSPHKFEKFDASKIGTGEGAQAYGHGLYFAESPGVAKSYQPRSPKFEEKLIGLYQKASSSRDFPMMEVLEDAMLHRTPSEIIQKFANAEDGYTKQHAKAAQDFAKWYSKNEPEVGGLYTVDLPDEKIARMLDWDKPLSEQPEVIKALKGTDYEVGMSQKQAEKVADQRLSEEADEWAEMTGGDPVDFINNADWEKYVDQVRKESGSIDSSITGEKLHGMIMRDEGYRPDLFDTENYQVGTSEALRGYGIPGIKYLDATSRGASGTGKWLITMKNGEQKVYDFKPNDDVLEQMGATAQPTGTSNFVVFPGEEDALTILERKKAGGEVKMAAGGISRLLGKGANTAKVDHPLVFPRAKPKTREEIRPIAQRVAEQMTGEFVRQNPKVTTNPVGKSRKQFERERNIPLETRNVVPEKNVSPVDYEKLKDYAIVGVPGDPSMGGVARAGSFDDPARATVELTRVGDITPDSPVPLFGGPRYGDDEKFWASNLGAATPIQSNVNALGELYDAPVLGKYIKMAPDSANFAMHNLDSLLAIQRPEQLSKGKLEQLNRLIRKGSPKYGKFPGFPGFDDPVDVLLQSQLNSDLRKHIAETLTKPTITQALGLPNGRDVVAAITHPELRNLETGVSGFSIGRMVPGATLKKGESAHPTYDTDIPGQLIGRSKYPTPYEIAFPDTTAYARSQIKPGVQEFNMMKLLGPRERIDQQYVDEMKTFEELMKQYTGKKKGGAVKSGLSSIKKV